MDQFDSSLRRVDRCPHCDGEGGTWNRPCEPCGDSGEAKMTVMFDGRDAAIVTVPHGRYRVERSQPATNVHVIAYPEEDNGAYGEVEMYPSGAVRLVKGSAGNGHVGRVPLELLDAAVLAAMAFRDRDAPAAA